MSTQVHPHKKSIHAALRIVIALSFLVIFFSPLLSPLGDTGYSFRDGLNAFLFAFIPTVPIVFLIPVVIRGTIAERIVAAIILLPSGALALLGWVDIIGAFMDTYFRH
ncbi:MAG: hypothetical protein ACREC8_05845 [Limisphaerales bacterium]